jgi:serine/threonine-protein kinase
MTDVGENGRAAAFFPGEIIGDCVLQKARRIRDERQEVWLAFDRKRNAPVVLKFIRDDHRNAAMAPALAEFLAHSQCRSLIRVLGTCRAGRYFAVELECASGGSLSARLKREGRLPFAQTVHVMREILFALGELHRNGIVHRDIKPGNIWITDKGEIRLGDFGIARMEGFPETGPDVFGTPSAMSPEQTLDTTIADARSDFFSLSSAVYELLSGHPRFPRAGLRETGALIRESRPEGLMRDLQPFATMDFVRLLGWMAEPEPGNRPPDADAILDELEQMHLPDVPLLPPETPEKEIPAE